MLEISVLAFSVDVGISDLVLLSSRGLFGFDFFPASLICSCSFYIVEIAMAHGVFIVNMDAVVVERPGSKIHEEMPLAECFKFIAGDIVRHKIKPS